MKWIQLRNEMNTIIQMIIKLCVKLECKKLKN